MAFAAVADTDTTSVDVDVVVVVVAVATVGYSFDVVHRIASCAVATASASIASRHCRY